MITRSCAVLAFVACSAPADPPPVESRPAAAPSPSSVLRPAPGVDLAGPIAPPTEPPVAPASTAVLDFAADRAVVPVAVPTPPRGGAVAFRFADDRRAWVARIPEAEQLPAVAFGNDKVYVSGGFNSTTFYALDATTGHIDWTNGELSDPGPTAAVYDDGRVVFNTESCTLFALDAKTGKTLWRRYIGTQTLSQTAVADGLVFAAHPSGDSQDLSAYAVKTGEPMWSSWVGSELLAAPVIAGDSVYVSTVGGWTFRFRRRDGKPVWHKPLYATTAPWLDGDRLYVTRRHAGGEQQIVVAADTGDVIATHDAGHDDTTSDVPRNIEQPEVVWAFEGSRPVIDHGVRYVAMAGELAATDAATGAQRWRRRYQAKGDPRSLGSVALAGPQVVVSTRDGQLFGLDVDTGYTLWSYSIGHHVIAEPIVAHGWVYATTDDGYVIALEVGDQTLDGWHMFGGNPAHDGPVSAPS